ncbi:MAG: efflux RND transporter periplasmic adaptor subunit [Rhodocyclaceae bacterium]|nr:efflux RND transporter periplasmic adaptor subunit [Rhodocyclaceae bacterium]
MNHKTAIAAAAALLAAGLGAGYLLGRQAPHAAAPAPQAAPAAQSSDARIDPKTGRRVLYWHDPMVPGQRFDRPGRSPFMDMDLVPVFADEAGGAEGAVRIDPRLQQNLGVRLAKVVEARMDMRLRATGAVAYDENAVAVVTARAGGFIDRLYVRALLDPVRAGAPLAELLAADWVAAQEEYLALARAGAAAAELRAAARLRLAVLGMPEDAIRRIEASGRAEPRVLLTSPISGVVGEIAARQGMTAMQGSMLFRINGLDKVWVNAQVPESQAGQLAPGAAVTASVPAFPGQRYTGRVIALLPQVTEATRSLVARVEVDNAGWRLKPGMYASLELGMAPGRPVLQVPSEAVIHRDRQSLVLLALGEGRFKPVPVTTGSEADGMTEIRAGLAAGQEVVSSAQFLIDSEASLKAAVARMDEAPQGAAQ